MRPDIDTRIIFDYARAKGFGREAFEVAWNMGYEYGLSLPRRPHPRPSRAGARLRGSGRGQTGDHSEGSRGWTA